jgi:pSer/pThr/pTyr-binding forkhead associated (FHA) protein
VSVCASCGMENKGHYKFCLGCGGELSAPQDPHASSGPSSAPTSSPPVIRSAPLPRQGRACPTCRALAPEGFTFCGRCGSRLEGQIAPEVGRAPDPELRSKGRLTLVLPDGTEAGDHPLEEGENLIGRCHGALFETDDYLSPRHAELILNIAGVVVRDAGSLNGTFVKLTAEEELVDGDVIRIGQELLRFDQILDPEPLPDGTHIMGSPNPGYWGRLALLVGPDQIGSAFPLFGETVMLGRERGDILFPEDGYVSGTHARVTHRDGRFFVADLNSSNGTFKRLRGERQVPSGTLLLMGQQLYRLAIP